MNRIRCVKTALAMAVMSMLLAGCGEKFPTLTQEEYDLIVDYSAGVLSKYNLGNGDKLTRLIPEPEEVPEEAPVEELPPLKPAAEEKPQKPAEEKPSPVVIKEETPEGGTEEKPAEEPAEQPDEAPEGDVTVPEKAETAETADAQNAVPVGSDKDLLQKMQDGLACNLNGYYVLNSYPDNAVSDSRALTAEAGNKLMILSFGLVNKTSGEMNVDLLNGNATYTLFINGQPVSRNMVTLLDTDMSTYMGTIGPGETAGAVLCFQVKEAQTKEIDTLSLKVNYHGEEQMLRIE